MIRLCVMWVTILSLAMAALQDSESKIRDTATSGATSASSDQGYYKSKTEVVGTKYEFNHQKFTPEIFSEWVSLFSLSRALEDYVQLIHDEKIFPNGQVRVANLQVEGLNYSYRQSIRIEDLVKAIRPRIDVVSMLKQNGVLDENLFLKGADRFSGVLNDDDFSSVEALVKTIPLPLKMPKATEILLNDLFRLIKAQSTAIIVNSLQTHDYQSRKTGFFDSLVDSIAGGFVGKVFMPDKMTSSRSVLGWTSEFSPYQFYGVFSGVTDYPYQDNSPGMVTLMGKENLQSIAYTYLAGSGLALRKIQYSQGWGHERQFGFPYSMVSLGLDYSEISDSASSMGFYNLFFEGTGYSPSHEYNAGMGLVYFRGTAGNSLGVSLRLGEVWYPVSPFHFYVSLDSYGQPNFVANKNNWDYYDFTLGVGFNVMNGVFEYGYRWTKVLDGWMGTFKLYL